MPKLTRRAFLKLPPLALAALAPVLPAPPRPNGGDIILTFSAPGLLPADWPISWFAPSDLQMVSLSLVVSGETAALVSVLTYAPPNFTHGLYIFETKAPGDNQMPAVYDAADFYPGSGGEVFTGHKLYFFVDRNNSPVQDLTIIATLRTLAAR